MELQNLKKYSTNELTRIMKEMSLPINLSTLQHSFVIQQEQNNFVLFHKGSDQKIYQIGSGESLFDIAYILKSSQETEKENPDNFFANRSQMDWFSKNPDERQ